VDNFLNSFQLFLHPMTILAATFVSSEEGKGGATHTHPGFPPEHVRDRESKGTVLVPSSTRKVYPHRDGTSNLSNPMAAFSAPQTRIIRGTACAHVSSRRHRRRLVSVIAAV
jgi:hypothetical protein